MITSEPNSPTAFANASASPERIAGQEVREDDAPEGPQVRRAERVRGLLDLGVELLEHRLNRAHDERQRHEHHREHDRRLREGER